MFSILLVHILVLYFPSNGAKGPRLINMLIPGQRLKDKWLTNTCHRLVMGISNSQLEQQSRWHSGSQ